MNPMSEERSISQLFGDSLAELAKLIQNEVDLARAELREKIDIAGAAAKLIAAGAVLVIPALVLILFAIATALIQLGLSAPVAYFCTGLVAAILAGGLIWVGMSRLSAGALTPSVTLDEIRRDRVVARELMR
jgi:Putative Actinobacterial Holin-X, holin superfamily III